MKHSVILLIREPELRNELARVLRGRGREVHARFQSEGWAALARQSGSGTLVVGEDVADADPQFIVRKAKEQYPMLRVFQLRRDDSGELWARSSDEDKAVDLELLADWIEHDLENLESSAPAEKDDNYSAVVQVGEEGEHQVRISGKNPRIARILKMIDTVAPTASTVLIQGESGTGKDLFAQLIHQKSRRRNGACISVNCGAIPPSLMESELFGHERGAFTGADNRKEGLFVAADGGTLFLDEVGELPLDTQVKLLRVLQSGTLRPVGSTRTVKVDVRIIAATNRDLREEVRAGRFRLDLFYRLNVISVQLPPLRDRIEDLGELLQAIKERLVEKGIAAVDFDADTVALLARHNWPGNIRELENIAERLLLLYPDGRVKEDELRAHLFDAGVELPESVDAPAAEAGDDEGNYYSIDMTLKELEEVHIRRVLARYRGNKTQAARALGINVKTLYNKMKAAGLSREEFMTPETQL